MKHIAYVGMSDVQEFTASDFEKAGVDHKKMVFRQGEPREVPDDVAELLLDNENEDNPLAYAKFEDVTEEVEKAKSDAEAKAAARQAAREAAAEEAKKADENTGGKATSGKKAKASSAGDDSGTSDSGPSSTGSGSST